MGIKPNVAIHFSLVLDAISKLVFGWLELDGHLTVVSVQTVAVSVVAEAMSVVATVGTVSKTMVAKAMALKGLMALRAPKALIAPRATARDPRPRQGQPAPSGLPV